MAARGFKNDKAHFFFNRQDRTISPGRITQIRQGSYGGDVAPASESELDQFLEKWADRDRPYDDSTHTEGDREVSVRRLFHKNADGNWHLRLGETDEVECKESFSIKQDRFADVLRAIVGLANNKGGYIFFGVKDQSYEIVGLPTDHFVQTDHAQFSTIISGAMDPVPSYEIFSLRFDGRLVGVIRVSECAGAPVIATKAINNQFADGAIYYRYVAQTRQIKPGELRVLIRRREQAAVRAFAETMTRVAGGDAATLDFDTGTLSGRAGSLLIDEKLLPQLKFVREGEFSIQSGAPTLKLVGEVQAGSVVSDVAVLKHMTDEDVLVCFLKDERLGQAIEYVAHSAHSGRTWLPIFFYAAVDGVGPAIARLHAEVATHRSNRTAAVNRLLQKKTAYAKPSGRAKSVLVSLAGGDVLSPRIDGEVAAIAQAITALTPREWDYVALRKLLLRCFELARGDTEQKRNLRSSIFRAACRLDELLYAPKLSTG